jgi:hypothetical protein
MHRPLAINNGPLKNTLVTTNLSISLESLIKIKKYSYLIIGYKR